MNAELCAAVWNALGAFDYAAANRLVARLSRIHPAFSNILSKLVNCENSYVQLSFMKPKWYQLRKDPLGTLYTYLVEDITKELATTAEEESLNEALNGLIDLCRARQTLIAIYQSIAAQAPPSSIYQELVELGDTCEQSIQRYNELGLLGQGIVREIRILQQLFRAAQAIVDYAFQDSCIALFTCKQDLTDWKKACQQQNFAEKTVASSAQNPREASSWRSLLFGSGSSNAQHRNDAMPHNVRWLNKCLENLTAKMTLYFSNILLAKERLLSDDDSEKNLWKNIKVDHYEKISSFRRRFGAHSIGLVYQVRPDVPFHPSGYVCSDTPYEPPQGIHSFPFIYCQPKQPPKEHLPNIISIIQARSSKLSDPKTRPFHFYDNKISSTYYLSRVDDHVVLVVIYLDKHSHSEPATREFMNDLVALLQGSHLVADLSRPE
ncbi:hypothetical protein VTP01DRAFT_7822 [Rhizomucor pusillus]|uniref:uncharacterized protein n=1 Tax=Rhizomucor pusillus TaxID=4840 RepID=UPI00374223F1